MTHHTDQAWSLDEAGWLTGIERIDSPNQDARPPGTPLRLIAIHAISLPPGQFGGTAVTDLFTNRLDPAAHPYFATLAHQRVSAHFFIRRDGGVVQYVSCHARAWHAGASCWRGRPRCNDFSLGIEIEGDDRNDFTAAQYQSLRLLLAVLVRRFPGVAIAGHADIAPGRKTDPGPHFDWTQIPSADVSQ
jgi:N-acetyl-anhydromuramoyl-L-alanine amidase